jgi:acetyl esterase/lipase
MKCFLTIALLPALLLAGCTPRLPNTVKVERDLEYARVNNQSFRLDLYEPKKIIGPLPVVVWIHGGAWNTGSKDPCPIGFMAAQNLAIVSLDYRLTTVAPFPTQLFDCKGAVRWLRANAARLNLDPARIGIFGASAGGHLALLLADTADHPALEGDIGGNLAYSSRVQCVCAFYPPTDLDRLVTDPTLRTNPHTDVAMLLGGAIADHPAQAAAASPLTYVDSHCAPVFLLHGGADQLVPPEQSRIFYAALQRAGVPSQLEIIPHRGHGIIAPLAAARDIYHFFNQYLGAPRYWLKKW